MSPTLRLPALLLCVAAPAGWAADAPAAHPAQALVQASTAAMLSDPEQSRRLAEQALQVLATRPDADLEVRARVQLCDYFAEHDAARAREQIAQARTRLPQAARQGLEAALIACEGDLEENAGNYARAAELFEQAVHSAERHGDDEQLANALYERGYVRGVQGNYALGLADLRRGLKLYEQLGLPARAGTALNGIAILYNRMGDHEQARRYYEQTLQSLRADGAAKREIVVTEHNLGRVYEALHQWDKARGAFEQALDISRAIEYPRGEAYALRGLASVHNARQQPDQALGLLQLADLLQQRSPDERLHAQILLQRGVALRQLGRPAEALPALQQALAVFQKVDSLQETVATLQALAELRAATGDWKLAYERQRDYAQAQERWLRSQLDQRFATLKVEFDTAATERENGMLLREKAATENALAQARRAGRLQAVAIGLAGALVLALAVLALHLRRSARAMQRLALTDELTGLPNRRDVLGRLQALLAAPGARPCALVLVDLDHFKSVNDDYGHPVGDELLKAVSGVLREAVPPRACLGRLGGEEFVAVLPDCDEAEALATAEAIRERVQGLDATRWFAGRRHMTASLGIAVSRTGDDVGAMLHRADEALYRAKAAGRNRVFAQAA